MLRYLAQRLLQVPLTLLAMATVVFILARVAGDPLQLLMPMWATREDMERLRQHLGFDRPIFEQYLGYLRDLLGGDFGLSIFKQRPALEIVAERLPATLQLAVSSMALALAIGVVAGVFAAIKRGTPFDVLIRGFAVAGQGVPSFVLGVLLIIVFAVSLRLLPVGGRDTPLHLVLPVATLGWYLSAGIARLTRSSMLDVLNQDYVRTARSKGLGGAAVVVRHALRNALLPVVTFAGTIFIQLLGGTILVESVFSWPGVGSAMLEAIQARDYPVIQAGVLMLATFNLVGSLIIDLSYALLNPRIRYG